MKPVSMFDFVRLNSGVEPSECSCNSCLNMCRQTPCLGTPLDIHNLIEAGYGDRLSETVWVAGLRYGVPPVAMIQSEFDEGRGCCTFLTDFGLCELHEIGLKPTEGKLATCNPKISITPSNAPAFIIAKMWGCVLDNKES